jgi:recombinational DNA repair ATPase RecF
VLTRKQKGTPYAYLQEALDSRTAAMKQRAQAMLDEIEQKRVQTSVSVEILLVDMIYRLSRRIVEANHQMIPHRDEVSLTSKLWQ